MAVNFNKATKATVNLEVIIHFPGFDNQSEPKIINQVLKSLTRNIWNLQNYFILSRFANYVFIFGSLSTHVQFSF